MTSDHTGGGLGRRDFVKLATLGGGVTLLAPMTGALAAGKGIEAVVLSCMDYRVMDELAVWLHKRGYRNNYDHLVLAGASLGALVKQQPAWGKTFWSHLQIAIDLHSVKKAIIVDHRDCGAYNVFVGKDHAKTRDAETAIHAKYLRLLRGEIAKQQPKLGVELFLMDLDGTTETIS
jgi:carbonic anhydrase